MPAKPPPTMTTWSGSVAGSGTCGLLLWDPGVEPLEQVVSDAERVRHRRERRVHRADAREEARVDDVEVVDLVRAAVGVEHRGRGIAAEAAGPGLVGDARDGNVVLEVGVARDEVVVVHPDLPEELLEL